MHGVLLSLPARPTAWCGQIARQHPDVSIVVQNLQSTEDGGAVETVAFRGGDIDSAIRTLSAIGPTTQVQLIERRSGLARFHIRSAKCAVACAANCTGLVPDMPFEVTADGDIWLVLGQNEELMATMQRLRQDTGESPRVLWSGEVPISRDILTAHQRKVLLAAVDAGFYAFPRRLTLTTLAAQLGVSKATLSETLMVIEAKIMRRETVGRPAWPPRLRHAVKA